MRHGAHEAHLKAIAELLRRRLGPSWEVEARADFLTGLVWVRGRRKNGEHVPEPYRFSGSLELVPSVWKGANPEQVVARLGLRFPDSIAAQPRVRFVLAHDGELHQVPMSPQGPGVAIPLEVREHWEAADPWDALVRQRS